MSRIIKNFEGSRQSLESRTFDMAELGEAAREIVASAKEAAELIVAEARVEAERLKAEAYAVGLEKGKSAVRGELEHELAQSSKHTHDMDIDRDGPVAIEDTGEHGHTLFGKSIWKKTPTASSIF